ncbi:LamB/YcsF family protein [Mesorhizobium sp. M0959]|uniref:LamB/YcsF family protein n=1 Tax=Mesorhizobium sp. M0959 TaxID=2957034 RepID=UPI00333BB041
MPQCRAPADGNLVSRRLPGLVIHDLNAVTKSMLHMILEGRITAIDGTEIALQAQLICIHGDASAAVIARTLSDMLSTRHRSDVHSPTLSVYAPCPPAAMFSWSSSMTSPGR